MIFLSLVFSCARRWCVRSVLVVFSLFLLLFCVLFLSYSSHFSRSCFLFLRRDLLLARARVARCLLRILRFARRSRAHFYSSELLETRRKHSFNSFQKWPKRFDPLSERLRRSEELSAPECAGRRECVATANPSNTPNRT